MTDATIWINERPRDWMLAIEPWAEAFDIKAGERVRLDLFDIKDEFGLETDESDGVLTYWIEDRRFTVTIGKVSRDFDYTPGPEVDIFSQLR